MSFSKILALAGALCAGVGACSGGDETSAQAAADAALGAPDAAASSPDAMPPALPPDASTPPPPVLPPDAMPPALPPDASVVPPLPDAAITPLPPDASAATIVAADVDGDDALDAEVTTSAGTIVITWSTTGEEMSLQEPLDAAPSCDDPGIQWASFAQRPATGSYAYGTGDAADRCLRLCALGDTPTCLVVRVVLRPGLSASIASLHPLSSPGAADQLSASAGGKVRALLAVVGVARVRVVRTLVTGGQASESVLCDSAAAGAPFTSIVLPTGAARCDDAIPQASLPAGATLVYSIQASDLEGDTAERSQVITVTP